jgi:hypothetical protein
VILPTDIPTRAEIDRLLEYRAPGSLSIYLPTDPASNGDAERIEFKTLAAEASTQLRNAGAGVRVVREFEEEIGYLDDDDAFWRYQARSLATFVSPHWLITFRLPNRLLSQVGVSDRFYVRPLIGHPVVASTAVGRGPRLLARARAESRPAPPGGGEVPRSGNRT